MTVCGVGLKIEGAGESESESESESEGQGTSWGKEGGFLHDFRCAAEGLDNFPVLLGYGEKVERTLAFLFGSQLQLPVDNRVFFPSRLGRHVIVNLCDHIHKNPLVSCRHQPHVVLLLTSGNCIEHTGYRLNGRLVCDTTQCGCKSHLKSRLVRISKSSHEQTLCIRSFFLSYVRNAEGHNFCAEQRGNGPFKRGCCELSRMGRTYASIEERQHALSIWSRSDCPKQPVLVSVSE